MSDERRATAPPAGKEEPGPGDEAVFAEIYRDHVRDVMSLLRGGFTYRSAGGEPRFLRVTSAFDAEELCQDVFGEFFRQWQAGTFDRSRAPGPYLHAIARNMALKRLGRASRVVLLAVVEDVEGGEVTAPPDLALETAERAQAVAGFWGSLEAHDRQVLERCLVEGASQQEVARALGLSRDQVYRTLVRVREKAVRFFRAGGWFDEA